MKQVSVKRERERVREGKGERERERVRERERDREKERERLVFSKDFFSSDENFRGKTAEDRFFSSLH